MSKVLEIACFNYQSAIAAANAGASRIEMCDNAAEGGTTPSFGLLKKLRKDVSIPIFPIIRPRGGDFLFSSHEIHIMLLDIQMCKELGFEGVVLGALNKYGDIDVAATTAMCRAAYPMEVTFHRAFDRCRQPHTALEQLIDIGCHRILTSGQRPVVTDNLHLVKTLIENAADRIIIMPGSGVRAANIESIARETGAEEFHSSARVSCPSLMKFTVNDMQEQLEDIAVDTNEIDTMRQILKAL